MEIGELLYATNTDMSVRPLRAANKAYGLRRHPYRVHRSTGQFGGAATTTYIDTRETAMIVGGRRKEKEGSRTRGERNLTTATQAYNEV